METCRTCAKCDFENGNNNYWLDLFHPNRWQSEMAQIRMEFVNWKLQVGLLYMCNTLTLFVACAENLHAI